VGGGGGGGVKHNTSCVFSAVQDQTLVYAAQASCAKFAVSLP